MSGIALGDRDPPETNMNNGAQSDSSTCTNFIRTGEMEVRAVRGVSLEIKRGEFVAAHGRKRFRQIDADEHPWAVSTDQAPVITSWMVLTFPD